MSVKDIGLTDTVNTEKDLNIIQEESDAFED